MSEYWVSKKRYFCKYCQVYIADDAPSRQHHENGLRHKGNVDRFVRGLYKVGEKRKKDADEEKREMMKIEQAASAAFAQDVGAGRAQHPTTASSSSSSAVTSSGKKPRKSGGISDYSTPESLGYTDPDIERALAEAERRRTQGVAGDWQMVESAPPEPPSMTGEEPTQHVGDVQNAEGDQGTNSNKRAVPDPADEDEGRWKLRKKIATVGLGEIYDPGIIAIKPKTKAEEVKEEEAARQAKSPGDTNATPALKWAPVKWKKAGEPADVTSGASTSGLDGDPALGEGARRAPTDPSTADDGHAPASVTDVFVKEEPLPVKPEETTTTSGESVSSGGSLFRKRKAPLGGGTSSRGRRF